MKKLKERLNGIVNEINRNDKSTSKERFPRLVTSRQSSNIKSISITERLWMFTISICIIHTQLKYNNIEIIQSLRFQSWAYSSWMAFYVLSFVSITNFQLNTNETKHQAVKKQNRIAGFLSKTFSVRMGNIMMIREAHIQLVAVEKGTILGCTI